MNNPGDSPDLKEHLSDEPSGYDIPVKYFPECFYIIRASVPVVDIICMFPHVAGEQWLKAISQRVSGVRSLNDLEASGSIGDQPGPA